MSSLEIAELTGKRHDHVMRDIRNMLEELEINAPKFGGVYTDSKGEKRPCFHLPKNLTITLVSGYSVVLRSRIVDRWMELEEEAATGPARAPAVALPNFSNPAEAARAWALQWGAGERGQIEKDHKHNLKDIEALISVDASIAPSFGAIEIPIKVGFGTRPYCAILRRLMPWSNRVSPFLGSPHRPHRRQLRVRHEQGCRELLGEAPRQCASADRRPVPDCTLIFQEASGDVLMPNGGARKGPHVRDGPRGRIELSSLPVSGRW
jgi:hypothetical protein